MTQTLCIDVVADVVCPWCYIGWRRLKAAMAQRPHIAFILRWRPYQLDPSIPEQGLDRKAYMAAKFIDPERRAAMTGVLKAEALSDGITLNFEAITVSPNTNAAQRLILWAAQAGAQDACADAVMRAYFEEGRDIGDPVVLADIGEAVGLPTPQVLEAFAGERDKASLTRDAAASREAGVTGVPFMLFDNRFSVIGAQSPERLLKAIDKAVATMVPA